jgi:hypothetical protein
MGRTSNSWVGVGLVLPDAGRRAVSGAASAWCGMAPQVSLCTPADAYQKVHCCACRWSMPFQHVFNMWLSTAAGCLLHLTPTAVVLEPPPAVGGRHTAVVGERQLALDGRVVQHTAKVQRILLQLQGARAMCSHGSQAGSMSAHQGAAVGSARGPARQCVETVHRCACHNHPAFSHPQQQSTCRLGNQMLPVSSRHSLAGTSSYVMLNRCLMTVLCRSPLQSHG